jgi:hypothetical protein
MPTFGRGFYSPLDQVDREREEKDDFGVYFVLGGR